uniref:Uncharacterized protein n=1 Tax=Arundo donax TaxID=35708 RepID=A0A0A9FFY5_ARUDO
MQSWELVKPTILFSSKSKSTNVLAFGTLYSFMNLQLSADQSRRNLSPTPVKIEPLFMRHKVARVG